jgi:hypothetical protein
LFCSTSLEAKDPAVVDDHIEMALIEHLHEFINRCMAILGRAMKLPSFSGHWIG